MLHENVGESLVDSDCLRTCQQPRILRENEHFGVWVESLQLFRVLSELDDRHFCDDTFSERWLISEFALCQNLLLLHAPEHGSTSPLNQPLLEQISESVEHCGLVIRHHRKIRIPEIGEQTPLLRFIHLRKNTVFHVVAAYFTLLGRIGTLTVLKGDVFNVRAVAVKSKDVVDFESLHQLKPVDDIFQDLIVKVPEM